MDDMRKSGIAQYEYDVSKGPPTLSFLPTFPIT